MNKILALLIGALLSTSAFAADTKISDYPAASALGGTEVMPGAQGGATKKISANQLKTFALTGNSATASALAANGTNCSAGQYARGVDASGNAENCTADADTFSGKAVPSGVVVGTTDSQTLTNKTLTSPAITTPTGIVKGDVGLGNVDNTADSAKAVATAVALAANGANCSANQAPLGVNASGAVESCFAPYVPGGTDVAFADGGTGLSSASDDQTLVSSGSAWVATTVPNCTDTGGNHLNYTQSTNAFSCGTSGGSGTPAGSNTQIQYNNSGAFGASSDLTFTAGSSTFTQGAGSATTTHSGGISSTMNITGGDGSASGSTGGSVNLAAGNGNASGGGGGNLSLKAGNKHSGGGGAPGTALLAGGDGTGGGATGGATTVRGGEGLSSSNGGALLLRGGEPATGTGQAGGAVTLRGGNGATGGGSGGDVTVAGGTAGGGTAGVVNVQTAGSTRVKFDTDGSWDLTGSSPGTNGQVFTSSGSGSAPTWTTITSGAAETSGSFNVTMGSGGCGTGATVGYNYTKVGNLVTLRLTSNNTTCTSNTTNHTSSAAGDVPVGIRPTADVTWYGVAIINNGTAETGCMSMSSAGTLIWERVQSGICQNNGYTSSGSRGIQGTANQSGVNVFTYTLQ